MYDGMNTTSAVIGTYCGQQRNLVLYSSESSLFVSFVTIQRTANTQNRGFKGIFEFSESFVKLGKSRTTAATRGAYEYIGIGKFLSLIQTSSPLTRVNIFEDRSECDQKILSKKESSGYVVSPNYPYPYIPKVVCRYFIYGMQDAQHLERVRLEFTTFKIPKNKTMGE